MRKISEMIDLDRRIVKKYIDPKFTPIYTHRVTRKSILDSYLDAINDLYERGNSFKTIL